MVTITKIDESFVHIQADNDFLIKLHRHFSYYAEGYRFSPLFKMNKWDGKIKLFRFMSRELPLGLLNQLILFCANEHREHELIGFQTDSEISDAQVEKFLSSIQLNGEYVARDYQKSLVKHAMNKKKLIGVSGTSSGKSLAQYILALYNLKRYKKRVLIIVPTTALVLQMKQDFIEYGLDNENFNIYGIQGGSRKIFEDDIIVSTWQSIYKKENYEALKEADFGMVLVDETHKAKDGAKIADILFCLNTTEYKIGVTGTLPKSELERQQMIGVLGEPVNIINARELIDRGLATHLNITAIFLKYNKVDKDYIRKVKNWQKETEFINSHVRKQNFIVKLALSQVSKGLNGIVFFNRTKFGKIIFEKLKEKHDVVYYVDGSIDAEERNRVRAIVDDGVILEFEEGRIVCHPDDLIPLVGGKNVKASSITDESDINTRWVLNRIKNSDEK